LPQTVEMPDTLEDPFA